MCGKVSQIHPVHSLFICYKNDLFWLNNLFMVRFKPISMSSYAKNKLQMTQHQCRHRQMWEKLSQIHPIHSLFICYKKWLVLIEQFIHGNYFNSCGCPLMLRTNYRCVQSPNISVDVAKCVEKFHKFTQYTHSLSVTKNDLSWLNNLFMVMFQLMRMSSYAKNKLQMFSTSV